LLRELKKVLSEKHQKLQGGERMAKKAAKKKVAKKVVKKKSPKKKK